MRQYIFIYMYIFFGNEVHVGTKKTTTFCTWFHLKPKVVRTTNLTNKGVLQKVCYLKNINFTPPICHKVNWIPFSICGVHWALKRQFVK